jgi:hypothetical protein
MEISLSVHDASKIARRFGVRIPPSGRGVHLGGDAGSLENDWTSGLHWVGTQSQLVRLSYHLRIIRSMNPVPLLTAGLVKRQIGMRMLKGKRR